MRAIVPNLNGAGRAFMLVLLIWRSEKVIMKNEIKIVLPCTTKIGNISQHEYNICMSMLVCAHTCAHTHTHTHTHTS